jgi:hypothetical protein
MSYSVVNFQRLTAKPQIILRRSESRIGVTLQNSGAQASPIFISTSASSAEQRASLRIDPAVTLLRDFSSPTCEIWAYTTAAGEAAGEGVTIWEDFN